MNLNKIFIEQLVIDVVDCQRYVQLVTLCPHLRHYRHCGLLLFFMCIWHTPTSGPYYCFSFRLQCIPPISVWLTSALASDLWANVISGEIFLNHPIYNCSLCLLLLAPLSYLIFSLAAVTIWQAMYLLFVYCLFPLP